MDGMLSGGELGTRGCFPEEQRLSVIELGSYSKSKHSVLPKANQEGLLSWLCPGRSLSILPQVPICEWDPPSLRMSWDARYWMLPVVVEGVCLHPPVLRTPIKS